MSVLLKLGTMETLFTLSKHMIKEIEENLESAEPGLYKIKKSKSKTRFIGEECQKLMN